MDCGEQGALGRSCCSRRGDSCRAEGIGLPVGDTTQDNEAMGYAAGLTTGSPFGGGPSFGGRRRRTVMGEGRRSRRRDVGARAAVGSDGVTHESVQAIVSASCQRARARADAFGGRLHPSHCWALLTAGICRPNRPGRLRRHGDEGAARSLGAGSVARPNPTVTTRSRTRHAPAERPRRRSLRLDPPAGR